MSAQALITNRSLAESVKGKCGENVYLCYSCKRCTSGCPLAEYMDLTPAELMRAVQFGMDDKVLNSKTLWLCAYCETCFTRCPQGIDIPSVMDTLKGVARERGTKPKLPTVEQFNNLVLRWAKSAGRVWELGLMAELNLRTGQLLKDADLGLKLFRAGKLKVLPQLVRYTKPAPSRAAAPAVAEKRVVYYPGCSQHATGSEYDQSARAVARHLGIQFVEPEGWVCCGTGAAHTKSRELAAILPMKTLVKVEAEGDQRMTTPCAACFARFKTAIHEVERDPKLKQAVADELGYSYKGDLKVDSLLTTFIREVGLDGISARVTKPLKDLKVVCYYGCFLTRPPEITEEEHPEYPMSMDNIVKRLGATVLDWSYKTDCCGASLMFTQTDVALDLSQRLLDKAKEVGAEAVVVACQFCQGNLDMRQEQIERRVGKKYDVPVIYFTQLMGLAFGLDPKDLALEKLLVSPTELLKSKNLLPGT
ncbi:MAG: 4Fe-4S dicluster domain-containing protein [Chloroflexi bacterium]|nr:4Fe-4S dicluster domain-containing protein [Chloroflexota bacterium]